MIVDMETYREMNLEMDGYHIPTHMRKALIEWIVMAVPPGNFLSAVLKNDLTEAVGRADDINIDALPRYIKYLYNKAPSQCWGSLERFSSWKGMPVDERV